MHVKEAERDTFSGLEAAVQLLLLATHARTDEKYSASILVDESLNFILLDLISLVIHWSYILSHFLKSNDSKM